MPLAIINSDSGDRGRIFQHMRKKLAWDCMSHFTFSVIFKEGWRIQCRKTSRLSLGLCSMGAKLEPVRTRMLQRWEKVPGTATVTRWGSACFLYLLETIWPGGPTLLFTWSTLQPPTIFQMSVYNHVSFYPLQETKFQAYFLEAFFLNKWNSWNPSIFCGFCWLQLLTPHHELLHPSDGQLVLSTEAGWLMASVRCTYFKLISSQSSLWIWYQVSQQHPVSPPDNSYDPVSRRQW